MDRIKSTHIKLKPSNVSLLRYFKKITHCQISFIFCLISAVQKVSFAWPAAVNQLRGKNMEYMKVPDPANRRNGGIKDGNETIFEVITTVVLVYGELVVVHLLRTKITMFRLLSRKSTSIQSTKISLASLVINIRFAPPT